MSEGYPDYARLSQQGGSELFAGVGVLPENTRLFAGYVGPWPYVNVFTLGSGAGGNVTVILQWFTDETFTQQIGFRYATRGQSSLAATQYANLSPWLIVFYTSQSGLAVNWTLFGVYGATGPATPNQLLSSDAPIGSGTVSVAANSHTNVVPQHVGTGLASLNVFTALATWHIDMLYLAASGYTLTAAGHFDSSISPHGGVFDMPMLDTEYEIAFGNDTAAAGTFLYCLAFKD